MKKLNIWICNQKYNLQMKRSVPTLIIRILARLPELNNFLCQGGILSPKLFAIYVDDLSSLIDYKYRLTDYYC